VIGRVVRSSGVALVALVAVECSDSPVAPRRVDESSAAQWKTWVLSSPSAVRPAPPSADGSAQTTSELVEIERLQSSRTRASDSLVAYWNALPTAHWHQQTITLLEFYWPLLPDVRIATPVRSARIFSLVNVAMYDAMVAAWDAKAVYRRRSPADVDSKISPFVEEDATSSYPSDHAAAAAAAAAVLSYLFPNDDTLRFHAMEREVGESRIAAGVAYRSDIDAGYAIGRAVAARVIARAASDGSAAAWNGSIPKDAWVWRPTPPKRVQTPFDPTAGSWKTWVLPSGNVYRPGPPPLPGDARFTTDLNELLTIGRTRTAAQADTARFWATDAPSSRWELFMDDEILKRTLGPMHAARALALASVAMTDAMIACWDAKFYYWLERPISADTTLKTALSTPPFPSYTSGHSTQSAAAAEVFGYLFPDAAAYYRAKADEASHSRVLAGIHYRFDVEAGEELGRRVGQAAVARAQTDGAK
jgi:membrane-associated phospholipid phosphatase